MEVSLLLGGFYASGRVEMIYNSPGRINTKETGFLTVSAVRNGSSQQKTRFLTTRASRTI
jgi:hypothetical protein